MADLTAVGPFVLLPVMEQKSGCYQRDGGNQLMGWRYQQHGQASRQCTRPERKGFAQGLVLLNRQNDEKRNQGELNAGTVESDQFTKQGAKGAARYPVQLVEQRNPEINGLFMLAV